MKADGSVVAPPPAAAAGSGLSSGIGSRSFGARLVAVIATTSPDSMWAAISVSVQLWR
jgi:hypothetical protein